MPAKRKPPHHSGNYARRAAEVRRRANADPATKCWRCGRTLVEHIPHKTGMAARWTAGHVIDGDLSSPLVPEASTCNYHAGAVLGRSRQTGVPKHLLPVPHARRKRQM